LVEMYRTFNMGIGFCIIISKEEVENAVDIINKDNMQCQVIGKIKAKGNGNIFIKRGNELLKI
jgi:phosphoribosylformylglycinamidine cyclo-ligase